MTREDLFIRVIIIVLVVLAVVTLIFSLKPSFELKKEIAYRVKGGDTLWGIASEYCPEGYTVEEYLQVIIEKNDLRTTVIFPGNTLMLYIKEN